MRRSLRGGVTWGVARAWGRAASEAEVLSEAPGLYAACSSLLHGRGCRWGSRLLLAWFAAVLLPEVAAAQAIQGRVLSTEGDAPLMQASVSLVDSLGNLLDSRITGSSGTFRFEAAPGVESVFLQAQALGFLTFFDGPVPLGGPDPVEVELRLQPVPIELDSLSVSVERRVRSLDQNGFYFRERLGAGYHLDRTAIQTQVSALTLADLLRAVPGVSVGNQGRVSFQGARSVQGCAPSVYLDGARVVSAAAPDPFWGQNLIDPLDVEGLEIYRRPSEVPVQYSASGVCGVVLIWSRRR